MSATVGKDFTMTRSKLIQFDPGTFCVYSLLHVFVRKSRDLGEDRTLCNFSQLETPQGNVSPTPREINLDLRFCPSYFILLQVNMYLK